MELSPRPAAGGRDKEYVISKLEDDVVTTARVSEHDLLALFRDEPRRPHAASALSLPAREDAPRPAVTVAIAATRAASAAPAEPARRLGWAPFALFVKSIGPDEAPELAATEAEHLVRLQLGAARAPPTTSDPAELHLEDAELTKLFDRAETTLRAIEPAPPSTDPAPSYVAAHLTRSEALRSTLDERLRRAGVSPEALLSAKGTVARTAALSVRRTLTL